MSTKIAEETKSLMLSNMPIFDTSKYSLLAPTKAGHTAFYDFFNKPRYSEYRHLNEWKNSNKQRILVLRDPVERMYSAINFFKQCYRKEHQMLPPDATNKNNFLNKVFSKDRPIKSRKTEIEYFVFHLHCRPFMLDIKDTDFKIIKFEELDNYLPRYQNIPTTHTTQKDITLFRKNPFFTKQDLLEEQHLYNLILASKEPITPEDWKELNT